MRLTLHVIIPVKKLDEGKKRLSTLLSVSQRRVLSLCMLQDVLDAVVGSEKVTTSVVISPDQDVLKLAELKNFIPLKEDCQKGVNIAVKTANDFCANLGALSTLILPSDIPLVQPIDIDTIIDSSRSTNSVVVVPSLRMDGTNALLRNPPNVINTFYDENSYQMHVDTAKKKGVEVSVIKPARVMLDLDVVEDLKEFMLIESNTATYRYLLKINLDG